jgi:spermidine synthase
MIPEHKEDRWRPCFSFLTMTVCGFAAAIGQIVILRELLVLFYFNELSCGLIFASWLLWTALGSSVAGRYGARISQNPMVLPSVLALLALLLPTSVLWIRAAKIIWAISRGEMVGPLSMFWISLTGTGLFCLASGALFGFAWAGLAVASGKGSAQPLLIYLGEALGAAMGGLFFYFVLLPRMSIYSAALVTALIILAAIAILLLFAKERGLSRSVVALWAVLALVSGALIFSRNLDAQSRHWQWGPDVLAVRDTPFQNLALLADANQFSVFANGLLFFSTPDPQTSEYAVHLAMLQHREPKTVLLIGGGVGGLLFEVLKHPGIKRVDYVEPDPEVIELAEEFLPAAKTAALFSQRVHLFHADASTFVRAADFTYDVVIMHLGDPVNAEMNRFYTVEFFSRIARLLNPDGIFSFAITASPDMIGRAEARLLQSVTVTLRSVFPGVLVIPGENARFLAGPKPENLTADPQELIRRIAERKLDLQYVREYYLFDYLNPMRLDYMQAILGQPSSVPINRDFAPTCYFNNLLVWAAQVHPALGETLTALSRVGRPLFWTVVGILATGLLCVSRSAYGTTKNAVMVNVFMVGGIQMVLEIILLLGFQILEGFVYTQLALIIAFFMAGMALGAGLVALLSSRIRNPIRWLIAIQSVLGLYILGALGLLLLLQQQLQTTSQKTLPMSVIFSVLALIAGVLSGLHFSLCVQAFSSSSTLPANSGPKLYALDLFGATAGVLGASLFVLPLYGLTTTMLVLVICCATGVLTLVGNLNG